MPAPKLAWDAATGRFRRSDGRFVPRPAVRRALEESLANLTRLTDTLADDLRAGRISLLEWRAEMRETIKHVQMAASELAHGGRAQMTQSAYGAVGQRVRQQYAYLERWVAEIRAGLPIDGRMEARATLYLRAARASYLTVESEQMAERGRGLVCNVLHASESCAECIAESDKGFVPVGQLSVPGSRTCLGNCRCTLQYRASAA